MYFMFLIKMIKMSVLVIFYSWLQNIKQKPLGHSLRSCPHKCKQNVLEDKQKKTS